MPRPVPEGNNDGGQERHRKLEPDWLLTPRQHEVLAVAFDEGDYTVPREATLTDVAETLGVSESTCSDILHRCESGIVTWVAAAEFTQP